MFSIARIIPFVLAPTLLVVANSAASAQANPTFAFGKAEEVAAVAEVTWTASAEAGLVLTTGNSDTTTATAAAKATRLDKKNKLDAQVGFAYARSTIFIAVDQDASNTISASEIQESTSTTANSWNAKLRYDRFITDHNSLYAAALVSADPPAGKELVAGGQLGYSRQLYKTTVHEVVAEGGYDFSYENLVVGDSVAIQSARVFAGYKGTINERTAIEGSLEGLANLNRLATVPEPASRLEDTRINAVASLSTKLTDDISFSFSFGLKFDNVPSPRGPLAIPYEAGFVPVADKLDTITKASLIIALF